MDGFELLRGFDSTVGSDTAIYLRGGKFADYLALGWLTAGFLAQAGCVIGSSAGAVYLGLSSRLASKKTGLTGIQSCLSIIECDVSCHKLVSSVDRCSIQVGEDSIIALRGTNWICYNRSAGKAMDGGTLDHGSVEGYVKLGNVEEWACYRRVDGGAYVFPGSERAVFGVAGSNYSGVTRSLGALGGCWSEFHDFFGTGKPLILCGANASERRRAAGYVQKLSERGQLVWKDILSVCCKGLVNPKFSVVSGIQCCDKISLYCDDDGRRLLQQLAWPRHLRHRDR